MIKLIQVFKTQKTETLFERPRPDFRPVLFEIELGEGVIDDELIDITNDGEFTPFADLPGPAPRPRPRVDGFLKNTSTDERTMKIKKSTL